MIIIFIKLVMYHAYFDTINRLYKRISCKKCLDAWFACYIYFAWVCLLYRFTGFCADIFVIIFGMLVFSYTIATTGDRSGLLALILLNSASAAIDYRGLCNVAETPHKPSIAERCHYPATTATSYYRRLILKYYTHRFNIATLYYFIYPSI